MNCEELLNRVIADLELPLKEAEATITKEEMPFVLGNSNQLAQVFQNLIANAIKYRGEVRAHPHFDSSKRERVDVLRV